jgi:hypothetical protein
MITQFTVGCSRTVNLGNFESIRIEAQVVVAVNEEQDFASLKDAAQVELRALMEETYANQYRKKS